MSPPQRLLIPERLSPQDIATARAAGCPRVKTGAFRCAKVLQIPALTAMLWPIRCMGRETVLIVGGLPVRHDMCDVNGQMQSCGKGRTRLCHGLNLQGGRRLLPKILLSYQALSHLL